MAGLKVEPSVVGNAFAKKYYTVLSTNPQLLYQFYTDFSHFLHGSESEEGPPSVIGKENIHKQINTLDFQDSKVYLSVVDCLESINEGVVVNVIGSLSKKGRPTKRFVQSFFLQLLQSSEGPAYYIINDIFRFLDADPPPEEVDPSPQQSAEEEYVPDTYNNPQEEQEPVTHHQQEEEEEEVNEENHISHEDHHEEEQQEEEENTVGHDSVIPSEQEAQLPLQVHEQKKKSLLLFLLIKKNQDLQIPFFPRKNLKLSHSFTQRLKNQFKNPWISPAFSTPFPPIFPSSDPPSAPQRRSWRPIKIPKINQKRKFPKNWSLFQN